MTVRSRPSISTGRGRARRLRAGFLGFTHVCGISSAEAGADYLHATTTAVGPLTPADVDGREARRGQRAQLVGDREVTVFERQLGEARVGLLERVPMSDQVGGPALAQRLGEGAA